MAADENAFGELIQDYIVESLPLAEQVADVFIELERRWRKDDPAADLLGSVKGQLHTIKGNSAMMGVTPAQSVAHALEDLCVHAAGTAGKAARRTQDLADLLVDGSGLLIELVRTAAEGSDGKAAAKFVARVKSAVKSPSAPAAPASSPPASSPAASSSPAAPSALRLDRRTADRRADPDASSSVVRVDFRRLDLMLEVLGEGMIEQDAVDELFRRLSRKLRASDDVADLDRALVALRKTLKRLEGIVMETRLLPISSVFGRFSRLVRDLAKAEKKSVRVITSGGETSLDKAVLDRIGEPLIHLLTNAVVHGIEAPKDRARAGKPEEGTLELKATSESGRVMIRLADDGRGLDAAKILAKAQELGVGTDSADMAQLHSLIFLPGFSTAESVSHLAGRGVGLDVVAQTVRGLGGTIDVESRPGRGVCFTLNLPLTLAVLRSLIVEVDRERYAVPISHVAATVRAEPGAIHQVNRKGVTHWRGDLIHVSDAGALLGTGTAPAGPRKFYVVISMGHRKRGLLVDRLIGHQDIVVKSLDPTVGQPEVVSGTTILGDGKVACILDAVRILEQKVSA
jgi:two-component system, chemotaxis family, sensor kinase CheA